MFKSRCGSDIYYGFILSASLGGTTALFVGASVLTVVETALFIIRHIADFIIGRKTGRIEVLDYKP